MDADLKNLAELALARAQREMTKYGTFTPCFMMRESDDTIGVVELEGFTLALLDSARGKDVLFESMRRMVAARGFTAVIFICEGWMGKQTEKGIAIGEEEFLRLTRERAFETAVKQGLVERTEVITVTVQTPKRTLIVHQEYMRDECTRQVVFGERHENECGVDEFAGRQKMYGDLRRENLY